MPELRIKETWEYGQWKIVRWNSHTRPYKVKFIPLHSVSQKEIVYQSANSFRAALCSVGYRVCLDHGYAIRPRAEG